MPPSSGLAHLWTQGDWVIRAVALILLAMSIASWLVILGKALQLRRHRAQARAAEAFWHASDIDGGLQRLDSSTSDNPFAHLVYAGCSATAHLQRRSDVAASSPPRRELHQQLDISDWVIRELHCAIDDWRERLQARLGILASVGSTAPFVGLFGTVWGIYHALLGIGTSGQASIDQVAGPIGEALIMTALGLAVAIPAVLGYNALVRGNKAVLHQLNRFAHDLHALLLTGARLSAEHTAGALSPLASPAPAPTVVPLHARPVRSAAPQS